MQDEPITQADRIAFLNLFKEIAAIGRQAREQRAAKQAVVQPMLSIKQSQPLPGAQDDVG